MFHEINFTDLAHIGEVSNGQETCRIFKITDYGKSLIRLYKVQSITPRAKGSDITLISPANAFIAPNRSIIRDEDVGSLPFMEQEQAIKTATAYILNGEGPPPEHPHLTKKQKQAYLNHGANACPYCESTEITAGAFEVEGTHAWQPVECLNPQCGATWNDIYKLVDVEEED